jgi:DNA-binding NarL/FixJ family response regulator
MHKEGASGYVTKNLNRSELTMAIEKTGKGEKYFNIRLEDPKEENGTNELDNPPRKLTPVQHEIITLLAKGNNHKEVATIAKISTSNVEKTLKLLRNKFNVKNNLELINHLIEIGEM